MALRLGYVRQFAPGKDVLDLCCGTGSDLLPVLEQVRSAGAGVFPSKILDGLRERLGGTPPPHLTMLEDDAAALSTPDASIDFAFSWTSLYYMPDLGSVLDEGERVLRPGGVAVLELGNHWSVNTLVSNVQHREHGWAKPYHVPYPDLRRLVEHRFQVRDWRSFGLLNSYGTPRSLLWLAPLTSERLAP